MRGLRTDSSKSIWVLLLFMLAGIVVGGFIGNYAGTFKYLNFLKYGQDFGTTSPFILDLGIIQLTFAIVIRFNISGVIGLLLSIFAYKRFII